MEQVPGETRYRLGPRIVTLAAGVRPTRSLVALARPHLAELAAAAGEVAGLSVPDGLARALRRPGRQPASGRRARLDRHAHPDARGLVGAGVAGPSAAGGVRAVPDAPLRALHARARSSTRAPSASASARRRWTASPGRATNTRKASPPWPRRSPTRRARSWRRSMSTDRRTGFRRRARRRTRGACRGDCGPGHRLVPPSVDRGRLKTQAPARIARGIATWVFLTIHYAVVIPIVD